MQKFKAYISFRNGCSLIPRYWIRREESAMHKSFTVRLVGKVDFEFVHYDALGLEHNYICCT